MSEGGPHELSIRLVTWHAWQHLHHQDSEPQASPGSPDMVRKELSLRVGLSFQVERLGTERWAQSSIQILVKPLTGWVTLDKDLPSSFGASVFLVHQWG